MRCLATLAGLVLWSVPAPTLAAEPAIRAGEEFLLPTGPGGLGMQATPDVAFGGGTYLAVWREGWHGKGGKARIRAIRISTEGKVVGAASIKVAPCASGVQERPRVAFGGGVFLVVWQDLRNGKDYDVLAARVSPEGKRLDAEPIRVAAGPRTQALPDVASDGRGFLVLWQGLVGEETAYRGLARPVGADGALGEAVETPATPQPQLAWGRTCYLAAYGAKTVFTVMLDRAGNPLNATKWGNRTIRSTKAAAFCISAAWAGWLVVGHRSPPDPWGWGGPGAIRAAQVNARGDLVNSDAVKEPAGVNERLPGWLDFARTRKLGSTWPWGSSASVWDGTHSLVVWQRHHLAGEKLTNFENGDLIAARVAGHKSLDPAGVPIAATDADETCPALASSSRGRVLCVYEKHGRGARARVAGRVVQVGTETGR